MSKRNIIISSIILAVVCIGGAVGVSMIAQKVESTVRESLTQLNVNVKTVSYSVLSSRLRLSQVEYNGLLMGFEQNFSIAEVEINDPDLDSLNPATPGRPRVASSILFTDITSKSAYNELVSTTTVKSVVIEDWCQNLGKLIALWQNDPKQTFADKAFWDAVYDYSVKSLVYSGYTSTSTAVAGRTPEIMYSIASIRIPKTEGNVFDYAISDMAFQINAAPEVQILCDIKKLDFMALRMPSAENMARVFALLPELSDPDMAAAMPEETALAFLKALGVDYAENAPYKRIVIAGINLKKNNPVNASASTLLYASERIESTLSTGKGFSLSLSEKNATVPLDFLSYLPDSDDAIAAVKALGLKELAFSTSIALDLLPKPERSSVSLGVDIKDVGALTSSLTVELPFPALSDMFATDPQAWIGAVSLVEGKASYTDKGLYPGIIRLLSHRQGIEPKMLLAGLQAMVSQALAGFPIPSVEPALISFMNRPGSIKGEFKAKTPMPLTVALINCMVDPTSLGISVTAEPGPRLEFEAIPQK